MEWFFLGVMLLVAFAVSFSLSNHRHIKVHRRLLSTGLAVESDRLNNRERAFFNVLTNTVGSKHYVMGKIKGSDLLKIDCTFIQKGKISFRSFSRYYFDFIVCDVETHQIVCAVDLKKTKGEKMVKRWHKRMLERFIQQYCLLTNLPRLVVPSQRGYELNELIERFEAVIVPSDTDSRI